MVCAALTLTMCMAEDGDAGDVMGLLNSGHRMAVSVC